VEKLFLHIKIFMLTNFLILITWNVSHCLFIWKTVHPILRHVFFPLKLRIYLQRKLLSMLLETGNRNYFKKPKNMRNMNTGRKQLLTMKEYKAGKIIYDMWIWQKVFSMENWITGVWLKKYWKIVPNSFRIILNSIFIWVKQGTITWTMKALFTNLNLL